MVHMKRTAIFTISAALALSLCSGAFTLTAFSASAEETDPGSGPSLFLPSSYEQYLPLKNPSDAAIGEDYIAVADGSTLYLYDRAAEQYRSYTHIKNGEERTISKLQFTDDGRLFFSDQDMQLYLYDFTDDSAEIQSNIPCSTFFISGDLLYTAAVANNITTFYAISHRNAVLSFEQATKIGEIDSSTVTPRMMIYGDTLYCAINFTVHYYPYSEDGTYGHQITTLAGTTPVNSLAALYVFDDTVYYTVNGTQTEDGFYRAELGVSGTKLLEGSGFTSLTSDGDSLYCIKDSTLRELKLDGSSAAYTGYEIGAGSDSFNRVSDAGETAKSGDLLVVADSGNSRVLVYDMAEKQYSSIPCSVAPSCVATDGEIIAVGAGREISLYRVGEQSPYYTQTSQSTVTGVACVYGTCYYVTEHTYGVAEDGFAEFNRSGSPVAITNDLYGNLYVADYQNRVYRYSEAEFADFNATGTLVTDGWTLPAGFSSLRADYEGNLYCLSGSTLMKNGSALATATGDSLVYRGENAAPPDPVSFALGFEDGSIYFQYGDFIVRSEDVSFPTLSTIAAENAWTEIFSEHDSASLSFVTVQNDAVGVRIDLSSLQEDSEFLSYLSHGRIRTDTETEFSEGVLLTRLNSFCLVAVCNGYESTVLLCSASACTETAVTRTETEPEARYLSNAISLFYYPCLTDSLAAESLPRSAETTLLGILSDAAGGMDYGYVEYVSDKGTIRGYLPLSYLSETIPLSPEDDVYRYGYLKANDEGIVFRSADGTRVTVSERIRIKIYEEGDGLFRACYTQDGVLYTAQVTAGMLESGSSDALRISIMIILCVIAVGIAAAYVLLVPRKNKR